MRCHWSFLATSVLFGVGALGSLGQFTLTTKEGRRVAAVAFLLLAATAGFLPSPLGIGICSSDGGAQSLADGGEMMTLCMVDGGSMDCQITAPLIWGVCALVALIAIIQWAKADPDGAVKPRFQDGA
jgi:hypothetical protein